RARAAGKRREGSSARGQLQEASTGKVHGSLLGHAPSSSHSWLGAEQRPRAGELTACLAGKQRLKLQQQSGLRLYQNCSSARDRVVDSRRLRVKNAALANPCLGLGVGFLPVRQKYDTLAGREAAHIDQRFITVGNLVQVQVLVLFRREVE